MISNLLWKIQAFILLGLCQSEKTHISNLSQVEIENNQIYDKVAKIAKSNEFSKIKLLFANECPRGVEKCSAAGCKVKTMEFQGRSGVIDLLASPESYSAEAYKTGPGVWKDIEQIVQKHKVLKKVVSGLRFSINTHIAAFYKPNGDGTFASNPWLFRSKMYNIEYEKNFILVYQFLRRAVAMLRDKEGVLLPAVDLGNDIMQTLGEAANTSIEIEIDAIKLISKMVSALGCLSCNKCMLWGTIQLKGLKTAVKAINGMNVSRLDAICLVNALRRATVSLREGRKLKEASLLSPEIIYVYWQKICTISIFFGIVLIVIIRSRYLRRILLKSKPIQDCI